MWIVPLPKRRIREQRMRQREWSVQMQNELWRIPVRRVCGMCISISLILSAMVSMCFWFWSYFHSFNTFRLFLRKVFKYHNRLMVYALIFHFFHSLVTQTSRLVALRAIATAAVRLRISVTRTAANVHAKWVSKDCSVTNVWKVSMVSPQTDVKVNWIFQSFPLWKPNQTLVNHCKTKA